MKTKNYLRPVTRYTSRLTLLLIFLLVAAFSHAQRNSSVAVTDFIDLYPQIPDTLNVLANDTIAPGDTIKRILVSGNEHVQTLKISDGIYQFLVPYFGNGGTDTLQYKIWFTDNTVIQGLICCSINDHSTAWLDTNDVRAIYHASGIHFFQENAAYFVPKWTTKTSMFSTSLWIGGKDSQGALHMAAQRYAQGPLVEQPWTKFDFYAGPVMDPGKYSIYQDTVWNRIWKIKKNEIEEYKANWWNPWYTIPKDILEWPGNGDTTLGQAWQLAPFYDMNGDGIYDPLHGDCPEVRGDECLYFIFNDDRNDHYETIGNKMKIEVHGMAYAFDLPDDSAMKTTTFINYKIYNRSQNTYDSTYIGFWNDSDLGYAKDDFVGCDVERSMAYFYNGRPADGSGQPEAYGENPPVMGFYILSGPLMDPDDIDNPRFNEGGQICDFSVNGRGFGDDIVDNERYGMTGYMYLNNQGVPSYMQDPDSAYEYYLNMQNKYKDGLHMYYGGNGHPPTSYGPECRFEFPGLSDSINWGTGCVEVEPKLWTEFTANNPPDDRRSLSNTGPFTFHPGDVQEVDVAYVWARDYSRGNSIQKLQSFVDQINQSFTTNQLSSGGQFYAVNDLKNKDQAKLRIYPNPASDEITLELPAGFHSTSVQLINSTGNIVRTFSSSDNKQNLDLSGISAGIYLIRVSTTNDVLTGKVVVK